jgi:hypothetical protein
MNATVKTVIYIGLKASFSGLTGKVYLDRREKVLCFVPLAGGWLTRALTAEDLCRTNDKRKLRLARGENIQPYEG